MVQIEEKVVNRISGEGLDVKLGEKVVGDVEAEDADNLWIQKGDGLNAVHSKYWNCWKALI